MFKIKTLIASILLGFSLSGSLVNAQEMYFIVDKEFNNSDNLPKYIYGNGIQKISAGYLNLHLQYYPRTGILTEYDYVEMNETDIFLVESLIKKVSGAQNYAYGLIFGRGGIDNNYMFVISGNGYYRISRLIDGEYIEDVKDTESEAINTSDGSSNLLSVWKSGNRLKFFINNKIVHTSDINLMYYYYMGFVLFGNLEIAIDYYKVSTSSLEYKNNYDSYQYAKKEKWHNALDCINKAISLNPNNPKNYSRKASIYRDKGDYHNAILASTKVIELKPRDPYNYWVRGIYQYMFEKYDNAIQDYTYAIRIDPKVHYFEFRARAYAL